MKIKTKIIVLVLISVLLIQSCSSDKPSLITGNPCTLPCWYGITPGLTRYDDALEILVPVFREKSIEKLENKLNNRLMDIKNMKESGLRIFEVNGVVSRINISTDSWTIAELFSHYNQPEFFLSFYQKFETTQNSVILIYPKIGFLVSIDVDDVNPNTDNSIISLNSYVSAFKITTKDYFWEYFPVAIMGYQDSTFLDHLHSWEGVGELETFHYTLSK